MAPEHPFPGSFNDAYDTLTWIQENAKSLGGNPSKIFISGCSAGANLAAAVTLEAKARNRLDGVMGQILVVPPTCHYRHHSYSRHPLESFREFSSAPLLSTEMMQEMWGEFTVVFYRDTDSEAFAQMHTTPTMNQIREYHLCLQVIILACPQLVSTFQELVFCIDLLTEKTFKSQAQTPCAMKE